MKSVLRTLGNLLLLATFTVASDHILSHNSNLRSGPSSQSKLLQSLPAETAVTIVSKRPRSGYVKVQTPDGVEGWVWERNVAIIEDGDEEPAGGAMNMAPVVAGSLSGEQELYPNPDLTPGAIDSRVTPSNIKSTICKTGYTGTVRPPTTLTNAIKKKTMVAYGFTDSPDYYELDHLISLELGGCPDCVTNLWPEMWGDRKHPIKRTQKRANADILPGARQKDVVEHHLRKQVCNGTLKLREAQRLIASDWYKVYQNPSKY